MAVSPPWSKFQGLGHVLQGPAPLQTHFLPLEPTLSHAGLLAVS